MPGISAATLAKRARTPPRPSADECRFWKNHRADRLDPAETDAVMDPNCLGVEGGRVI